MIDMQSKQAAQVLELAEFVASLPECPPDFFKGKYVHLKFDWSPFINYSRSHSRFSVSRGGFAEAVLRVLSGEDPEIIAMFVGSWAESSRCGEVMKFMRQTFGMPKMTLRQARERAGLSKRAAARAADIDVRTLRRREVDWSRASSISLARLCREVYNISLDQVHMREADADIQQLEGEAGI